MNSIPEVGKTYLHRPTGQRVVFLGMSKISPGQHPNDVQVPAGFFDVEIDSKIHENKILPLDEIVEIEEVGRDASGTAE